LLGFATAQPNLRGYRNSDGDANVAEQW